MINIGEPIVSTQSKDESTMWIIPQMKADRRISLLEIIRSYSLVLAQCVWPFSKRRLRLWILLRLAWQLILRVRCVLHALTASDERMEPRAESKAEAVVSKRAYVTNTPCQRFEFPWSVSGCTRNERLGTKTTCTIVLYLYVVLLCWLVYRCTTIFVFLPFKPV